MFTKHRRLFSLLGVLGVAGLATALLSLTPLRDLMDVAHARKLIAVVHDNPQAALLVPPLFVLAGLAFVPTTALTATIAIVFGPLQGCGIALLSGLMSATVLYAIGRKLGPASARADNTSPADPNATFALRSKWMQGKMGARLEGLKALFQRHAFGATVIARVLPINFTAICLVAGAALVPFRPYFLGSVVGLIPEVVIVSTLAAQLEQMVSNPSPLRFVAVGASVILLAIGAWWLVRIVDRTIPRAPQPVSAPSIESAPGVERAEGSSDLCKSVTPSSAA